MICGRTVEECTGCLRERCIYERKPSKAIIRYQQIKKRFYEGATYADLMNEFQVSRRTVARATAYRGNRGRK
jgi:hypothetical protein